MSARVVQVADRSRLVSKLGDRRERAVLCRRCFARQTMAVDAVCDVCHDEGRGSETER